MAITMTEESAVRLHLEAVDGAWVPRSGVELTVVVGTGAGVVSIPEVTKIITGSDAWWVYQEGEGEVSQVGSDHVILVRSKGGELDGKKGRTGFG